MVRRRVLYLIIPLAFVLLGAAILGSGAIRNVGANDANYDSLFREQSPEVSERVGPIDATAPAFEPSKGNTISPITSREPNKFLSDGGRAVIKIKPDESRFGDTSKSVLTVEASRGSTIEVPVTVTHLSGSNSIGSLTIAGVGVSNGYVPAAVAREKSPEQTTQELVSNGKIAGELDLDATLQFVPQKVTLKPNETGAISLAITIPKDWPDYIVGETIWYSVEFAVDGPERYDSTELMMNQVPLQVHIEVDI